MLAQINTTVGAIKDNLDKIIETIDRAKNEDVDLVVFPELTITGYPPKDLLSHKWFIENNKLALNEVIKHTENIGVVCGFADENPAETGKDCFNSAALLYNRGIILQHNKCLLPTYDVFDEGRYFEPSHEVNIVEFKGVKVGLAICEDMWVYNVLESKQIYDFDPIEEMAKLRMELLIVINASPFNEGKRELKNEMISETAKRHVLPIVNVNLVGGNDGLIFDGASNCFDKYGNIVAQSPDFVEDFSVCEYRDGDIKGEIKIETTPNEERTVEALCLGLKDYMRKCGFKKVVIGLSGGIDSALTAAIAVRTLGNENVIGVSMPSQYSSQHSKDDAEILAKNLGIKYVQIPIKSIFDKYCDSLSEEFKGLQQDLTEENIQARVRGTLLMAFANKFGAMVLATGNKSELAVGYCTLYGDMCGGLCILADVPKTMVYKLSHFINREKEIIPHNSIIKPPSAELRPDQKDTDSLPEYDILDAILKAYIEDDKSLREIVDMGYEEKLVKRVLRMINLNEYKRQQASVALKVTTKAFGYGRRFPIATGGDFIDKMMK